MIAYAAPGWTTATATATNGFAGVSYHVYSFDELGRTTKDILRSASTAKITNQTAYDQWSTFSYPPTGGNT